LQVAVKVVEADELDLDALAPPWPPCCWLLMAADSSDGFAGAGCAPAAAHSVVARTQASSRGQSIMGSILVIRQPPAVVVEEAVLRPKMTRV
jgi:hypothetical protein